MDKLLLKIFLNILNLLPLPSINKSQVGVIASTKVLMDRRRTPATWKRTRQKENRNGMLFALLMYGLMGFFIGIVVFAIPSFLLSMIIIHSYLLFMIIMTMITDFSNVLLDTSDSQIILPKPVTQRTLLVSRTIHILVYLGQLLLAIMIFPIIFSFVKYGWLVGCSLLLTTLLTTMVAILVTYILYGIILRYANEQKVKDIIGYFQIFMTIVFALGYQLIPRLIDLKEVSMNFTLHWYSYFLPPVWMAYFIDAIFNGSFDFVHISLILCAVLIPVMAAILTTRYLAPYFSRFAASPEGSESKTSAYKTHNKKTFIEKVSKVTRQRDFESAAFMLVWRLTGRDKTFKLQFYPALAYIPVFIFIIFFKNFKNIGATMQQLPESSKYLWLLYLSMFSVTLSLTLISYYENYSAAWVYQSAPINEPGKIINGAIKSLLIKFFVPVYIVLSVITLIVWGVSTIDDILLAGCNSVLMFYISALLSKQYLPFSQQPNTQDQSGKFATVMLRMILIAILVGLHYLALKIDWLVLALIPFSIAGIWFASKKICQLQWSSITS